MAIVRRVVGRELDPETRAAMEAEVREAAKRPYVYDPDCPLLTEEQLAEFRPVNYATNEERLAAMGIQPASPEEVAMIEERVRDYESDPSSFVPLFE